ncbi:Xaa-Pro aminopeptidase [Candidatus Hakubella thermalkaliphila]|uniref:Xaa-Pro aminopeptidase n=3 Tax=Candidatus Hakubella thermalkaliphila TaxID=2754717 RepID=A0A6V8PQS9_9ACTN|nr:Xaa-Pro peptidase family protein [Candidatus Hakubella thermalkaliphila]GFP27799.1 Xaa-Pro aminopeptidase [Candidatus Hakubella thermalkaliphila]GFP34607.1 Xaa-Pro aminopeptidase [Candidatus Hakubella thermalkaliphila]
MKNRLERAKEEIEKKGFEAILISQEVNVRYLSGFCASHSGSNLLITPERQYLLTDFRFLEQARRQAPQFILYQWKHPTERDVLELVREEGIRKMALEDSIPFSRYRKLKESLTQVELCPLGGFIEKFRQVKDQEELERIREAADINDKVFPQLLAMIEVGAREIDIANELEYVIKKMDAQGVGFETVIASGTRSSMPHAVATDKRICQGDMIKIDFGSVCQGYHSDMTRMATVGEPSEKLMEIYNIVLEAQLRALEEVRPGQECRKVDRVARAVIEEKGYGSSFGHGVGHGVGLEIHEAPRLSPTSNGLLEEGMVITIEPGIYLPGFGGVRIEDLVYVKKDGGEIISQTPKELYVL